MVPKTLDWKGELAKLIPFLRTFVLGVWHLHCFVHCFVRGYQLCQLPSPSWRDYSGSTFDLCFHFHLLGSPINHRIVLLRRQRISDELVSKNWVPRS